MTTIKRFALLFPGQGSQLVGMGKDLVCEFPYIQSLFTRADHILNFSLSKVMFEGPVEELKQTEITQPALLLHSYSILKILEKELGFKQHQHQQLQQTLPLSNEFIKHFDFMLGHSLGEYTALLASNSISFDDALRLVRHRGELMKECKSGVMAALLSKTNMVQSGSLMNIKSLAHEITTTADNSNGDLCICNISNVNSPNQVVISGTESGVNQLIERGKKLKLFTKAIKLPVSAAFHSDLMKDCSNEFSNKLSTVQFSKPESTVISNVTYSPYNNNDIESIPKLLSQQLVSTVEWTSSIDYCTNQWEKQQQQQSETCFIEIGSGKVLTELVKQISPLSECINIGTSDEVKEFIKNSNNIFKDNKSI
ncbi:hypothetical protein CYY_002946 [Polysphondylium violaceum]|uniref:[acyl-carrier-protein] S-malonyltransferase n=1 Tax=Polysphondylium violaceum TaxID=133409 RepID=A0A8J4V964_9MYCE|nr:hypothetical protein CYY_002946 [Polysphondylium violaceum]